jgi:hypothetical protein
MPALKTQRRLAWLKGGLAWGFLQEDDALEAGSSGKPYMLSWALELAIKGFEKQQDLLELQFSLL